MFGTGTFASAPFATQAGATPFIYLVGVSATAYLNSVSVKQLVFPNGVAAVGGAGIVVVGLGATFLVSGVEGLGRVTSTLVWSEINSASVVNWVEIPT